MRLAVRVDGLEAYGVALISPERVDFDALAVPLLGERIADVALKLKPMLAIVSNESPQTVVSFSVAWNVTHKSGARTLFWGHSSFPDFVCGDTLVGRDPEALPPNRTRIEARGLVIHRWGYGDEYYDQFLDQFVDERNSLLANAIDLQIELNAVIFADGTLVGPDDDSQLESLFSLCVRAKQEWYRGVTHALNQGRSVADAFAPVEQFSADVMRRIRAREVDPRDRDAFWKIEAAADVNRWRRRYRDDELPDLLQRSIRLEPFVIRRNPSQSEPQRPS